MTDPSAALFFSTSITTRPPAPGRFSTIVVDAYAFICSARSLAITSLGPPGGKPTRMRAVECNGCDRVDETPNTYEAMPPALPTRKCRRLGLSTRRASVIAAPCCAETTFGRAAFHQAVRPATVRGSVRLSYW